MATATDKPLLSLEDLAARVVVEHLQLGATPSGYFASGVFPRIVLDPQGGPTEVIQCVQLHPTFACYDPACPRNFGTVVESAKTCGIALLTACQYYTKSKLRYACSAAGMQFLDGVVPKLEQSYGITSLPVGLNGSGATVFINVFLL